MSNTIYSSSNEKRNNSLEYETLQFVLTPSNSTLGATGIYPSYTPANFGTNSNPVWRFYTSLSGDYDINITSFSYGTTGTYSTYSNYDTVLQLRFGQFAQMASAQQAFMLISPFTSTMPFNKYSWKIKNQRVHGELSFTLSDYLFGVGSGIRLAE